MEEEPKITTVTKVKDHRRVAQGKRLAAISREAKAKKARERQEHQQQQQESEILPYFLLVTAIVITTGAFGGYRYLKKGEPVKGEAGKEEKREENSADKISGLEDLKKHNK